MRFCAKFLSLALCILAGCGLENDVDYGFVIKNVSITPIDQALNIGIQQELELSQQAREALEHGVTLTISLDMELRNNTNRTVTEQESRVFSLRYLPLSERYQVTEEETGELRVFSRLRHLLAGFEFVNVQLSTGPLSAGDYHLRTRIRLDERLLPAPMQLPAWLSPQWQHDSEWSVWPFKVNV